MNEELLREVAAFKANKERHLGRLLGKSYRFLNFLASEYLENIGYKSFRIGHVVALIHIDLEGININALSQRACITKQAMSKLIKELQNEGYVSVEKDINDARALIVKPLEKGLQAMLDWKKCMLYVNEEFAGILGNEKLETLKDLLLELSTHYENTYQGGKPNDLKHLMMNKGMVLLKTSLDGDKK